MSLRVLHVVASGAVGGGAVHVRHLASALQAMGVQCAVISDAGGPLGDQCRQDGTLWYGLPLMQGLSWTGLACLYQRWKSLLLLFDPDVVHLHGTRAGWYWSLLMAPQFPVPTLYTAHGFAFRRQDGWGRSLSMAGVERVICRKVHGVITVAQADRKEVLQRGWRAPQDVHHLGNAIAPAFFRPEPKDKSIKSTAFQPPMSSAWRLGTTARLVPQKGIDVFLAGCAAQSQVAGYVAGDGPLRAKFGQHEAVLSGQVRLLGDGLEIADYLGQLDAFALTSRWEGEPIALLEAMAMGVVCIASATPGAVELLDHGQRGWLFPIGDVAAFVATCEQARHQPLACRQKIAAGRAYIKQRTYPYLARQMLGVYGQYSVQAQQFSPSTPAQQGPRGSRAPDLGQHPYGPNRKIHGHIDP